MNELERTVGAVLRRYMSEISAQSVRRRAQRAIGVDETRLAASDLPRLRPGLEGGVRLFVDEALQAQAIAELETLVHAPAMPENDVSIVADESDVSRARLRARELAQRLGGGALAAQRAATVVSELARNIVSYAGDGRIELAAWLGPPRELVVRAIDRGPGIASVDAVLAGRHASRTGLGKGLAGVKKLATHFEIATSATGTRIECRLAL